MEGWHVAVQCAADGVSRVDSEYRVVTAGDRNAGRGLTVQNLHCSELARWPGDAAETLAGLRAALAPDAEVVAGIDARWSGWMFSRRMAKCGARPKR